MEVIVAWKYHQSVSCVPDSRLGLSVLLSTHLSQEHRWLDRDWRPKLSPLTREKLQSSLDNHPPCLTCPNPALFTPQSLINGEDDGQDGRCGGRVRGEVTQSVRNVAKQVISSSKECFLQILIQSRAVTVT